MHVGLGVDAESTTGAPRVYSRAGLHPEKIYIRYRKQLRDGTVSRNP
jgi:hypothetical protein